MNNYEYIIASLPDIDKENKSDLYIDATREFIHSQLSEKDNSLCAMFESGFDCANLDKDFYDKALESSNSYIRNFFRFDLALRNCKVRFINKELERPSDMDILDIPGWQEHEDMDRIEAAFTGKNLLSREKAIDELVWNKSEDLVLNHIFDLDIILSFLTRLNIVGRWLGLDKETGMKLFRKLIEELNASYTI